jgi:hypothetical protein
MKADRFTMRADADRYRIDDPGHFPWLYDNAPNRHALRGRAQSSKAQIKGLLGERGRMRRRGIDQRHLAMRTASRSLCLGGGTKVCPRGCGKMFLSLRVSPLGGKEALQGAAELTADGAKCGIDFGCQTLHRSNRAERDQCHDERIFDQILAVYLCKKNFEFEIRFENQMTHFFISPSREKQGSFESYSKNWAESNRTGIKKRNYRQILGIAHPFVPLSGETVISKACLSEPEAELPEISPIKEERESPDLTGTEGRV